MPFDKRLMVAIAHGTDINSQVPYSGAADTMANTLTMSPEDFEKIAKKRGIKDDNEKQKITNKLAEVYNKNLDKSEFKTQYSMMNPYARIRLTGALDKDGTSYLTDKAGRRPWYEMDRGTGNINYSKYPTTSAIIEYGNADVKGRTPYQFQDFVFCKWWNKIPNNRMITLRRYSNPILDNLEIPVDDNESSSQNIKFAPLVTAVSYFGEQTDNKLSEMLKFSTGMKWGEVSAGVWSVEQDNDGTMTHKALSSAGGKFGDLGKTIFGGLGDALNALSIIDGSIGDGMLEQGLPPDPYENGPYANRIMGPVNRIDTVKKRDAGLNFEMNNLKIKFDYVARPIGGVNSKAILLDILSNFMMMGSASAVFFGGAHRFKIHGSRFPALSQEPLRKMYSGDVFGGIEAIGTKFNDTYQGFGGVSGIFDTILEAGKELFGNLLDAVGNPLGMKTNADTSTEAGQRGKNIVNNGKRAIEEKFRTGLPVQYLRGMRALLVGEPVGDWHLTIGNPMNPIAMIGNLICTNIEVEFDDEAGLGPDDFPLAFRVTVTLDHGMLRDRDAIESIFNRGNGRIYESGFLTSADNETATDTETGKNNKDGQSIVSPRKYVTTNLSQKPITAKLANSNNSSKGEFKMSPISTLPDFSKDSVAGIDRLPRYYLDNWVIEKKVL